MSIVLDLNELHLLLALVDRRQCTAERDGRHDAEHDCDHEDCNFRGRLIGKLTDLIIEANANREAATDQTVIFDVNAGDDR